MINDKIIIVDDSVKNSLDFLAKFSIKKDSIKAHLAVQNILRSVKNKEEILNTQVEDKKND